MDKKAKKASVEQKLYLVQFMEENMDFAYDRFECVEGAHKKYKMWQDLTAKLNSISGAYKDSNQWRKFWTDQKLRVKEREALLKASFQRSSKSGFRKMKELTPYESRVLSLSGHTGNSTIAVAKFSKTGKIPTADSKNVDVSKQINISTQAAPSTSAGVPLPSPTPLKPAAVTHSTSADASTASLPVRKRKKSRSDLILHTLSIEQNILKIEESKLNYIKKIYDLKKRKMEWQKEYQTKCLLLRKRELKLRKKELKYKIKKNNND